MTDIALGIYTAGLVLVVGLRTFMQIAAASNAGRKRAPREHHRPGPAAGAVVALLALALAGALAALWLVSHGSITPWDLPPDVGAVGVGLEVVGFIAIYAAQESMGAAWRFGINPDERVDLVTKGLFSRVRHPVYSALVVIHVGVLLAVPHVISLLALVAVVAAAQLLVRVIEEPHLVRQARGHAAYAADTGRFVPGIGRVAAARR